MENKRYSIFPLESQDLWNYWKDASSQFWTVEEIDLSADRFNNLTSVEKKVVKTILAFFTVSDGIVIENLVTKILPHITEEEAKFYYNFQVVIEQIHAEMYGLMVESYIKDVNEKAQMYDPINNMKTVEKKANWALKWIENSDSLAGNIAAFAVVEG